MKDKIIEILSETLNPKLVNDVINSYDHVKKAYTISDFEGAQSKSGKFVENLFRLLHYMRTGKKITEIKDMNAKCENLKNLDKEKLSDSIRLIIPRIALDFIYLTRSKLGSVHVKGSEPDFIDAKLTVDASDWIIAELLRTYHRRDSESVRNLIKNIGREVTPILQKVDDEIFINVNIPLDQEILIRLFYANDGFTRKELGNFLNKYVSPFKIRSKLKELTKTKKIHYTIKKKYILANFQQKVVESLVEKLSVNKFE